MANIDDTTPQLKVVKGLNDALIALNIKDVEPLLSRDFVLRTFPKSAELPDLTKEQYLQKNSAMWALSSKVDVRVQPLGVLPSSRADFTTPIGHVS